MNNNKKYFPVYKGTLADARKELSIDLYLDSKQWNLTCKTAIEYILDRNSTTNLKQAVKELLDDFGEDRVVFMIANTVQYYTYEDWFSKENEKWAGEIDIPEIRMTLKVFMKILKTMLIVFFYMRYSKRSKKKRAPIGLFFLFWLLQNINQTKPRVVETVHANSIHVSFVLYRKYVRIASVFYKIFHHSYLTCKQIMTI